jgi:hypothetical protein
VLQQRCYNDNHARSIVTVRFCSSCGSIVNRNILIRGCADETHARMRRSRYTYCVDCGERLLRLR